MGAFHGTRRFELRRVIGEGGMGVVYEAFDRDRQLPVALKSLRWVDAQAIMRLKTEFRVRADLEHRNLVRLGELHHDEGAWFFTMELVEGVDFLEWVTGAPPSDPGTTPRSHPGSTDPGVDHSGEIALDRRYDERRLRAALRQLASGLDALHGAGMIHRDLKPSNVMVTNDGRVVLLDFGLVAEAEAPLSDTSVVGTAAYMSPEQAMSRPPGPPSDWYSVGVMLYEALTGRLPIDGSALEILMRKQHRRPPRRIAEAPADLSQLCVSLLAIDPAERPTGADVLRALAATSDERSADTPFVGRAAELATLERALAEVTAGATLAISIEGESGIGKTKLVRHFLARAATLPGQPLVLSGRCHEREAVPFKALDGVVDAIARTLLRLELDTLLLPPGAELTALAQTFPVLLRVPAIARQSAPLPSSLLELRARAFRGLRHLLDTLAAAHPLLITIDDLQWADADSLTLLAELVHGPGSPRILLVLTRRDDGEPPALPIPVTRMRLAPLSAAESTELVARIAPERAADSAELIAGTGGHPMFLRELLRHIGQGQLRGARLDDAIWTRITRMDVAARRVLELIAVAGRPLPQRMVADVLGVEPRRAARWFGALRAASLARTAGNRSGDSIEPYHDRVREAVVARIAPARRRRYHLLLATMLTASGYADRDPLTVVEHLEAAGRREQAAELARRSARRPIEQLAFEQVAALCTAALRLTDALAPDERRALIARRAEALAYAGRGAEAARDYLEAAAGASPDEAFQRRRAAGEQLLFSGHISRGLELLAECLDAVGDDMPRTGAATRRALVRHWIWRRVRGTCYRARPPEHGDPRDHARLDLYRTASLGLSMIDAIPGALCQVRALRIALRLGDPRRVADALAFHAMYSAAAGERHAGYARTLTAKAAQTAEAERSPFLVAWAHCCRGVVEYFAGRFGHAVEILIEAEAQLREHAGAAAELNNLRMFLTFAMRRHGCFDRLRIHYLEYVRDALRRGDRYAITTFRWSANAVWLAADDVDRAHAELAAGTWSPPEEGLHLQHWFLARGRAELALYEADPGALGRVRDELTMYLATPLAHIQVVRVETAIELARIAILQRDVGAARAALARLRRERTPYVRAMALLAEAAADALDGRPVDARAHLTDAATLSVSAGMHVAAALARRRAGAMLGGGEGARIVSDADAVMRRNGIVHPGRFARAFASWPGGSDE